MNQTFIPSKILFKIFFYVYIPIAILLIVVFLMSFLTGIPLGTFTRDPAVIAGKEGVAPLVSFKINPFIGIISNLGILLWCTSAVVCFFSYFLGKAQKKRSGKINDFLFLRFFGSVSLLLLFDDLFLFHESIAPKMFLPEKLVYFAYLVTVLFGIAKFRRVILRTEWSILCLAFTFFSLSIILDISNLALNVPILFILEDGAKLLGIASWSSYFFLVSFQATYNSYVSIEYKSDPFFVSLELKNRK